jgi:hypothetical protein
LYEYTMVHERGSSVVAQCAKVFRGVQREVAGEHPEARNRTEPRAAYYPASPPIYYKAANRPSHIRRGNLEEG